MPTEDARIQTYFLKTFKEFSLTYNTYNNVFRYTT